MSETEVEANAITGDELPTRWEIELEFVQSLSNIQYLSYLAQNSYLTNDDFLRYLDYLNYWKNPEYAKYLVYPNCLHILTLLQNEEFRTNIVNPEFMSMVMNDMVKRWNDDGAGAPAPASVPAPALGPGPEEAQASAVANDAYDGDNMQLDSYLGVNGSNGFKKDESI